VRILVAGASTRALAQSALAAGYDFLSLDYFGDCDQKACCENYSLAREFNLPFSAANLYRAGRRLALDYDAFVYTAGLENHPRLVAQFAVGRRLLGNSPGCLARVRDGSLFFGACARLGAPGPVTLPPGSSAPALPGVGWLRKPVRSGGGHEIARWPAGRAPGHRYVMQEHVPGRACSVAFLAGPSVALLGICEQLIGSPEFGAAGFMYCGNIFPLAGIEVTGQSELARRLRELVTGLVCEFGLVGLNGLDFILRQDDSICPLELNPRYSASMELMELAGGPSMFASHIRTFVSEPPASAGLSEAHVDAQSESRPAGAGPASGWGIYCGKAILYAERDCRVPDTRSWRKRGLHDVPFTGDSVRRGSPICTILARGPTREACYATLVARAESLKEEIYV
jgi:uncharacterized protein